MGNRRKWYSILLVGLILLLAIPLASCAESYTKDDLNNAYQQGYDTGFDAGLASTPQDINAAYRDGYNDGYADGLAHRNDGENGEEKELPTGAISWDEAIDHIGDRATVCGPVKSTYYSTPSKGKPTFLNIGKAYPDPDRFVVIIWGSNRSNFHEPPEDYYLGKTICITGLITEWEGIAEIEVSSPDQIQDP